MEWKSLTSFFVKLVQDIEGAHNQQEKIIAPQSDAMYILQYLPLPGPAKNPAKEPKL